MRNGGDTYERIWSAADQLFEQNHHAFPTVDAVRKAAQVNMNDASAAMRQWRQRQLERAQHAGLPMPPEVERAGRQALEAVWATAQAAANLALAAAQEAWEHERGEAEAMGLQLADAFDAQGSELEAVRAEQSAAQARADELGQRIGGLQGELARCQAALAATKAEAARADTKAGENKRRADELRTELDRAHRALAERVQADDAVMSHEKEAARRAQETAAALRGEVAALKEQNRMLTKLVARAHPDGADRGAT